MTYWFFPKALDDQAVESAIKRHELVIPAGGLPNLTRAHTPEQIGWWLNHVCPDTTPERTAELAHFYWTLSHDLTVDDVIIVPVRQRQAGLIGRVQGDYRFDAAHILPMQWNQVQLPTNYIRALQLCSEQLRLVEITDEEILGILRPHMAPLHKSQLFKHLFAWLEFLLLS